MPETFYPINPKQINYSFLTGVIGKVGRTEAINYGTKIKDSQTQEKYYLKLKNFFESTIKDKGHLENLLKEIKNCETCAKA